jgi:DNA replication licensing factor MCM2
MTSIRSMCANNLASFEVSYQSLSSDVPILAIWVADAPRDIIESNRRWCDSSYFDEMS